MLVYRPRLRCHQHERREDVHRHRLHRDHQLPQAVDMGVGRGRGAGGNGGQVMGGGGGAVGAWGAGLWDLHGIMSVSD